MSAPGMKTAPGFLPCYPIYDPASRRQMFMSFSGHIGIFVDRGDGTKRSSRSTCMVERPGREARFVMPMWESRMRLITHDGCVTKSQVIVSTHELEASLLMMSPTFRAWRGHSSCQRRVRGGMVTTRCFYPPRINPRTRRSSAAETGSENDSLDVLADEDYSPCRRAAGASFLVLSKWPEADSWTYNLRRKYMARTHSRRPP